VIKKGDQTQYGPSQEGQQSDAFMEGKPRNEQKNNAGNSE